MKVSEERRKNQSELMMEISKKIWSDPEKREEMKFKISMGKVHLNLKLTRELGYVVGVIFGDGYIGNIYTRKGNRKYIIPSRIELKTKDIEFAKEFFKCCKMIGLNPNIHWKKSYKKNGKDYFYWRVVAYSKILVKWINKLNLETILKFPIEFKIGFIRGLFDSDGTFYNILNYQCKFANTNFKLVEIYRKILSELGFTTSICIHKPNNANWKPYYEVNIVGGKERNKKIKDFLELIQPSIPRKRWCERQNG